MNVWKNEWLKGFGQLSLGLTHSPSQGLEIRRKKWMRASFLSAPSQTFLCFLPEVCLEEQKPRRQGNSSGWLSFNDQGWPRKRLIQRHQLKTRHCKLLSGSCPTRCSQAPSEETGTGLGIGTVWPWWWSWFFSYIFHSLFPQHVMFHQ